MRQGSLIHAVARGPEPAGVKDMADGVATRPGLLAKGRVSLLWEYPILLSVNLAAGIKAQDMRYGTKPYQDKQCKAKECYAPSS